MALDPEELVTLTNHGTMKLRSAVARAMMLLPQERDLATIIRESEPTILNFERIKLLAAHLCHGHSFWARRTRPDPRRKKVCVGFIRAEARQAVAPAAFNR